MLSFDAAYTWHPGWAKARRSAFHLIEAETSTPPRSR